VGFGSTERERERVSLRENTTFSPYGPFVAP
jgi:hypothetical protein